MNEVTQIQQPPSRLWTTVCSIVEGALQRDQGRVLAHAEHLAVMLRTTGDPGTAKRLDQVLKRWGTSTLAPSGIGTAPASLPVDTESRLALADEYPPMTDAEVILNPEHDAAIANFITYYQASDRLEAAGVGQTPAILLHGPPGCGKTVLGHTIASRLGLPLLVARIDSMVSSYLGATAKNLRLLFDHARSKPCVLFLDEFDAIAKIRDDNHELGELKRVVVGLLQNIDSLGRQTVLVAATNHEHLLDRAIWRRFTVHLHLDLPDERLRRHLLERFIRGYATSDELDLYARLSEGLSGAVIRTCVEDGVRAAIVANATAISWADMVRRILALRQISLGDGRSFDDLHRIRELDPRFFTQKRLAELHEFSVSYVQKILTRRR